MAYLSSTNYKIEASVEVFPDGRQEPVIHINLGPDTYLSLKREEARRLGQALLYAAAAAFERN